MLDGLFHAVKGEICLSQVIVRKYKSKIGLAVIEYQQLIERKFLNAYIDEFLASLIGGCLPEIVKLNKQVPRDLIYIPQCLP